VHSPSAAAPMLARNSRVVIIIHSCVDSGVQEPQCEGECC
jgi:hypothetical protein